MRAVPACRKDRHVFPTFRVIATPVGMNVISLVSNAFVAVRGDGNNG